MAGTAMENVATTAIITATAGMAMFIAAAALSMTLSLAVGWACVASLVRVAARKPA
ncbi:MAG: hypothetical protein HY046_03725 [Acidobacteria bacterium]|nr:hypothetical protein [Acidobacteriota bacterium]